MELSRDQKDDLLVREYDACRFHAHDVRGRIVEVAQHATHILKGDDAAATSFQRPDYNREGVDDSPAGIPGVRRERKFEDFTYHKVDSIGGYIVELHPDERPSVLFNAGFYAGVLAAKEGLIDPDNFTGDFGGRELVKPDSL